MISTEQCTCQRKQFHLHQVGRVRNKLGGLGSSASIPTRYLTVVVKNDEKKGFNSGTQRFQAQPLANDVPGPGKYAHAPQSNDNVSFSKRGLGSFASKSKRFPSKMNPDRFADPGQYNVGAEKKHDFNKAKCTSIFHKPIANKTDSTATPAPNSYSPNTNVIGKNKPNLTSRVKHPPFLSSSDRGHLLAVSSNPAPNAYGLVDPVNSPTIQAPFKSTSKRLPELCATSNPGPGAYNPHEEVVVKKNGMPRKHYLCYAAPALTPEPAVPLPGPGQYDIVDYVEPRKEHAGSSMFRSSTVRMLGQERKNSKPGPGTYNPREMSTTFHYNSDEKWM